MIAPEMVIIMVFVAWFMQIISPLGCSNTLLLTGDSLRDIGSRNERFKI
jgi:hypothetical protein